MYRLPVRQHDRTLVQVQSDEGQFFQDSEDAGWLNVRLERPCKINELPGRHGSRITTGVDKGPLLA